MNYKTADSMLQGRNKDSKKLENNTYLVRTGDDDISIRLHATNIITFRPDGRTVIDSAGWWTVTTKDRLNKYLSHNLSVYSDKGIWTLYRDGTPVSVYRDGITIGPRGGVPKYKSDPHKATKKRIKAYCKAIRELAALPKPGPGDCWYCLMYTDSGEPLGDCTGNHDHLYHHLEEQYIHGSLIVNAMRYTGSTDTLIALAYDDRTQLQFRKRVVSSVRRYFKKQLGIN